MITREHLEHWVKEVDYQLSGLLKEIADLKLGGTKNVLINDRNVSFEYLREKATTSKRLLQNITWDINHDE